MEYMKRIYLVLLLSMVMVATTYAQRLTDEQVTAIALQQKKAGVSDNQIVTNLMKRGATLAQIQRIRQQNAKAITKQGLDGPVDNAIGDAATRMRQKNTDNDQASKNKDNSSQSYSDTMEDEISEDAGMDEQMQSTISAESQTRKVFGRDIFNNRSLTFEPQMNIATPQNYVLGPGDILVIDVYGASQESLKLTVSPDGDITVPDFGPIQVSGLTVAAARSRIASRLGRYFQSSQIKTTLGQTRSIQVNVMGEVRVPGTYTLSAFATVFHALYRAGGINDLGTLRNIKVYRQGRLITVVDVYEFILNGRLAGNIRLQENDVIQVGAYDCIVDLFGHVKRPMAYELRQGESLSTLMKYSGGFSADAYKKTLRVYRKSGRMKSVFNVDEFDMSSFKMEDGDEVTVDSIYDRYENMVEVKGAVFRPGMYQLGEKVFSVRSLLERAEGLTEEALPTRAVMRRMKPNRTQEVLSVNVEGILAGSEADIPLQNEDVLFVPTQAEHTNQRTLTIEGEVIFPGVYEYAENMTIEDMILQAGGLTDAASTTKVDVSRRIRDPKAVTSGMQISKTFSFSIDENFKMNEGRTFFLEPYDIVQVRRSPVFQDPITVTAGGEIAFRGTYTMERKNQRLSDLVHAAGGAVEGADVRGARLIRKMSEDEKARIRSIIRMARQNSDANDSISLNKLALRTTYPVGIHLDEALAHPGSSKDIELMDGDELIIPRFNHTVRISGDVYTPNTVAFESGKDYKYYIEQAGGFGDRAKKRNAYIVYQNGTMAMAKKGKIEPGCEIIVPSKEKKDGNSLNQWLGIGASMASLATMLVSIANLVK